MVLIYSVVAPHYLKKFKTEVKCSRMQSYSSIAEQRAMQVNGNLTKQAPSSRFHSREWALARDLLS